LTVKTPDTGVRRASTLVVFPALMVTDWEN
jgi:hypothetical protein